MTRARTCRALTAALVQYCWLGAGPYVTANDNVM